MRRYYTATRNPENKSDLEQMQGCANNPALWGLKRRRSDFKDGEVSSAVMPVQGLRREVKQPMISRALK